MKILFLKEFDLPAEETTLLVDLVGDGSGEEVPADIYLQVSMVEDAVDMTVKGGTADNGKAFDMAIISSTLGKANKITDEGLYCLDGAGLSYLEIKNTGACKLRVKALV